MVAFWWLCGDQCHLLQGALKAYLTTTRGDCVFSSVHLLGNARTDLERGTVSANCMGPSSVNAHHNYENLPEHNKHSETNKFYNILIKD